MKSGTDLEQTANATVYINPPGGGVGDARHDLEQRGLATAVAADDSDTWPSPISRLRSRSAQIMSRLCPLFASAALLVKRDLK